MSMKCHICSKPISSNYYIDSWDHKICATHFDYGEVAHCSCCTGFADKTHILTDGRVLCSTCNKNVINNDDIEFIKEDVLYNLYKYGFKDLTIDTITVKIATAEDIAKIRNDKMNINIKGLTVSQVNNSFSLFASSRKMQHTIYILEYLPKIEFAGMLAHELLHAWQVQNNINPPPMWCEGLCNLGTYYTYTKMPSPLTKIFKKNLINNPDPIYGDGFRNVLKLETEIGINQLIDKYKQEYK